jgi:hypothetical protein
VWQSLFLPQLDSFDMMPSRSRKADTRGVSIIPQNQDFIYNKIIKKMYVIARRRSLPTKQSPRRFGDCFVAL